MANTSELKSGWLHEDMERAEKQVNHWKIKKYEPEPDCFPEENARVIGDPCDRPIEC